MAGAEAKGLGILRSSALMPVPGGRASPASGGLCCVSARRRAGKPLAEGFSARLHTEPVAVLGGGLTACLLVCTCALPGVWCQFSHSFTAAW